MIHAILLTALLAADPKATVKCEPNVLVGHAMDLAVTDAENVKRYVWEIEPSPTILRKAKDDGSALIVGHDEPGAFRWRLDVTSPDGGLTTYRGTFNVVAKQGIPNTSRDAGRPAEAGPAGDFPTEEMDEIPPPTAEAAVEWFDLVKSPTREADARRIANALMQEANALSTGLASTEHFVHDVGVLVRGSLTERQWQAWAYQRTPAEKAAWQRQFMEGRPPSFLESLGDQFDWLKDAGLLESADDYVEELMDLARVLKKFASGRT